jgi:hypothetical protein
LAPRAGAVGYVVIELKTGEFQPEYAGKLNFYVVFLGGVLASPAMTAVLLVWRGCGGAGVGQLPDTLYPARA